jgi:hypothetical protein
VSFNIIYKKIKMTKKKKKWKWVREKIFFITWPLFSTLFPPIFVIFHGLCVPPTFFLSLILPPREKKTSFPLTVGDECICFHCPLWMFSFSPSQKNVYTKVMCIYWIRLPRYIIIIISYIYRVRISKENSFIYFYYLWEGFA